MHYAKARPYDSYDRVAYKAPYTNRPHNLGGDTTTYGEFLEQYDCFHLHPKREDDPAWRYDATTDTIYEDYNIVDEVSSPQSHTVRFSQH